MAEKITDISSPQNFSKISSEKKLREKPSFHLFKKLIGIFLVLALFFGAIIFLNSQKKLTLYLGPKTEPIEFQEEIEVNVSQETIDFQERIIPGKFFEVEKEKWEIFQTTGKDFEEGKAQGIIRIYNTHTPPIPVTLRASTRFLSSEDGKIFKISEKVYLPPAQVKDGEVIPTSQEVLVVAQAAGEDYNIGPSNFSVPGLVGSALYYSIWAESISNMEGGFRKEIKKVTSQDLETAKKVLKESLRELAENSLKNEIKEPFVLDDKAIFEEDFQASCFEEVDSRVPEFNCQGKIKLKGLSFKISDLREFAIKNISTEIPASKRVCLENLNLNFFVKTVLKAEGKMISDLKIEGAMYEDISIAKAGEQIEGKSKEEIERIIFENFPQVESIEIKFWPFWIKKAPKNVERIKIELTF